MQFLKRRSTAPKDSGQTAIEYLGILAVVAAIIVILLTTDFGTAISNAITDQISKVTGDE